QPKCNEQIIASEHEAIHHLFQQEAELHRYFTASTRLRKMRKPLVGYRRGNNEEGRRGVKPSFHMDSVFWSDRSSPRDRSVTGRRRRVRACPTCPSSRSLVSR